MIWDAEPGVQRVYHVSIMKLSRVVGIVPDDDTWAEIVADTGDLVDTFFDRV